MLLITGSALFGAKKAAGSPVLDVLPGLADLLISLLRQGLFADLQPAFEGLKSLRLRLPAESLSSDLLTLGDQADFGGRLVQICGVCALVSRLLLLLQV